MQLIIPDCCVGEFCPGIHADGHRKKDDGTYYSTDDCENNAYHYHNTDGSVFYRYSDGSEYHRRKNGNITFRPPEEPHEKVEGADPATLPSPTLTDRAKRPWYDWPPQLNLSIKTNGSSVIIRDASGSAITFEPVGSNAEAELAPVHDRRLPSACAHLDRTAAQASQGATSRVQEWVNKQALADVVEGEKGPRGI